MTHILHFQYLTYKPTENKVTVLETDSSATPSNYFFKNVSK